MYHHHVSINPSRIESEFSPFIWAGGDEMPAELPAIEKERDSLFTSEAHLSSVLCGAWVCYCLYNERILCKWCVGKKAGAREGGGGRGEGGGIGPWRASISQNDCILFNNVYI